MIEFMYLFLFRCLSGAQNGFGYAKNDTARTICTIVMMAAIALLLFWVFPLSSWIKWAALIWLLVGLGGTVWVEDSFNENINILPKEIHLAEILATSGVLFAWVALNGNLIYILASVYPSLLIHKGLINLGSGLNFWDHRTDDETGDTFGIPLLGWKIPRLSLKTRILIAVLSLLVVVVNSIFLNWELTFIDLISWL